MGMPQGKFNEGRDSNAQGDKVAARLFDTLQEAEAAAGEEETIYVRSEDFDQSLPGQWAVDGYPSEELGEGWVIEDVSTPSTYA